MDYAKYRNSGELSDLTVIVDGERFKLHKFPLFVRSNYFKNASSSNQPTVTLNNFPGGSKTFDTIADYCYGKDVDLNYRNVVPIRCATEYLQMTGNDTGSRPNLATMTENVLFDVTHTAKSKRDYNLPLTLLNQAAKSEIYAEPSGIHIKLIDSFLDSLSYFMKTSSIYDSYNLYDHKSKKPAYSALNTEQIDILNSLPLNWMLELIKSSQKVGLNPHVLASIVQNYLDYNTNLNPHYNSELSDRISKIRSSSEEKPMELISMAADILKVERKLNNIADNDNKPNNLIKIMSDVHKVETESKPTNLISMAADILKTEPKPTNLINMTGDILNKDDSKSNLIKIMEDIVRPNDPKSSIDRITSQIIKNANIDDKSNNTIPKIKDPSHQDKLQIISAITKKLKELRLEPQFPLPWLLNYLNALHNLDADADVKSAFNHWAWDAMHDLKNDSNELGSIPPSVIEHMAADISPKNEHDTAKLVDLIDRYVTDLDTENKLTPETFIKLASAIPNEKRRSNDKLMQALLNLLKKENHNINSNTQKKMLDLIDFNKLSEKTLEDCKKSEFIPPQYITEAALALCAKLRKELEDSKLLVKSLEYSRPPNLTTSSRFIPDTSSNYSPRYSSGSTRNRSVDPSYRHIPTNPTSSSSNKVIYPIPVSASTSPNYPSIHATPRSTSYSRNLGYPADPVSSSYQHKNSDRDHGKRLDYKLETPTTTIDHSTEFYTDESDSYDHFYAASYSYSSNY